ncbi:MAG: UDP-glucose 4-epimerase GalE, partial [Notoacmeibacter sp.]|nr:UDP-glucose 4-epimerase GalE [Notoacmeibacter sp.]
MSVLVTGGAGYIGSHMVLRLLDAGEDVVVLDDLSTGHEWAVPSGAELVVGDVGDADLAASVVESHGVSAVMHFAGSILVFESVADPLGYYLNNTVNTRTLVETALRCGVGQFVFSSTAAVYGSPGLEPIGEDAPLRPESPYGTSKLVSEWMLRDTAAANPQIRYAALRYFNVAGADPQLRSGQSSKVSTHLIKIAAEAASGKRPSMKMFGDDYPTPDGTCVRD